MAPESAAAAVEAFFLKALGPLNNLPKMMTAIKAFRLVNSDQQLPASLRRRLLGDLLVKTFDKDEARADVIDRLLSLEVRSVFFVLSFDCGSGCRTCTKVGFVRSSTRTRCGLLFTSLETFHFRSLLHPSACAAPECVLGAGHHHPYCCRYETGQARHHFLYEQGLHLQRKQHHVCIQVPQPTDAPRELTSCCYSREHDVDMGEGAAAETMPAAKRQKRVHAEVYPADISSALFFESTCDTVLTCPCCWQPALIP